MAAGLAVLNKLNDDPAIYHALERTTQAITKGIAAILDQMGKKYHINSIGSMYSLFFTDQKVIDFETAKTCDTTLFGAYFRGMLNCGVYLAPSQFESLFISSAISASQVVSIIESTEEVLHDMHLQN